MSETWRLYQLQRADSRLAEIEKALGALRGDDAHLRRFAEAEAAWHEAESEARRLKKEFKELEHEDSTLRDRRKALEGKLYGGRISNPKELTDFQKELDHVKERIDVLEEDMLARMEDLEARDATVEKLREQVGYEGQTRANRQSDLDRDIQRLEAEAQGLKERRRTLASEFSAAELKRYDDLRLRKHGIAVARIVNHSCDGCRMHLTEHKIQEAKTAPLATCGTCGRILYIER